MAEKLFEFKKKYGQNFLKDDSIPNKIVNVSNIKEDSLVIEIGPGAGSLTSKLVTKAKQVLAYEIDDSLENILDENLVGYDNVDIIFDDFLKRNIKEDLKKYSYTNLYVIANLPYYITTPIITKIIEEKLNIEKIVVMVQKEVADRFSAKPGTKDYGSITVFLNYYFDIKKEFVVSRNCFVPKPNVDSCIISFVSKNHTNLVKNEELFFQLVRDSFKFKRKTLRNNLRGYSLDKIETVLSKYKLDLSVRAETLPLDVFIDISNNL